MTQVTAIDADDSTYGTSAKLVYSLLEGQPYFSVDPETGQCAYTHGYTSILIIITVIITLTLAVLPSRFGHGSVCSYSQ